ncbi:hypothetical protein [Bartonella rattaustraliani]|uniref:hypothetical protein n=1 Tax=Bartonella rattaustraliani TaxID=481139 RepID=UPI00031AF462|nr:hypothetical protein [Bartonella rattaustraliani]
MIKNAVILAPVMPLWDHGDFCRDLQSILIEKGVKIDILDTTSIIKDVTKENNLILLAEKINKSFCFPFLLIGFALGGSLAQVLAPRLNNVQAVLSISGPGYVDTRLKRYLEALLNLLNQNALEQALELLYQYVQPLGMPSKRAAIQICEESKIEAIARMMRGFELLLQLDARDYLCHFAGKFLSIIGKESQLATISNQVNSGKDGHECRVVEAAGMRPWDDNPLTTTKIIDSWVKTL